MPATQIPCFQTEIKNMDTVDRSFLFIPPHGRIIPAGSSVKFYGNIVDSLIAQYGGANKAKHYIDAYHLAIENGDIKVLSTPAPIMTSANGRYTMQPGLNSAGELVAVDACTEAASESLA